MRDDVIDPQPLTEHLETLVIVVLCIAGIVGHIVSICALHSVINPNNMFLMSMSCSQLALCANFLYSSLFKYLSDVCCVSLLWSRTWVYTLLISVNVSVVVHMSGVFHVVALSVIRFLSLKQLVQIQSASPWLSYSKCLRTIIAINVGVVLICTPFFFNSELRQVSVHERCALRHPDMSTMPAHELSFTALGRVNLWLLGTVCKLIPCALLVIMTALLIQKLRQIQCLSKRFTSPSRERKHRKITYVILVIMAVFVIIELPQGILSVLSSLTGFTLAQSELLGDLFDLLSLLNSCVIFALFCSINSRIRLAFIRGIGAFNPNKFIPECSQSCYRSPIATESNSTGITLKMTDQHHLLPLTAAR